MCMFWYALDVLFTSSTIIHLTMISIDRYYALKFPLRYGTANRKKNTKYKIVIVWIIAICIAGPLFGLSMYDNKDQVNYKGCGPESPVFVITASVASFFLPLCIMFVMYILTVVALHQQSKAQKQLQKLKLQQSKKYSAAAGKKHSECDLNDRSQGDVDSVTIADVSDVPDNHDTGARTKRHGGSFTQQTDCNSIKPLLQVNSPKNTSNSQHNGSPALPTDTEPCTDHEQSTSIYEMSLLSPSNQPLPYNGTAETHYHLPVVGSKAEISSVFSDYNTSEFGGNFGQDSNSSDNPSVDANKPNTSVTIVTNKQKLTHSDNQNSSIKSSSDFISMLKSKLTIRKKKPSFSSKKRKKHNRSYSSEKKGREAVNVLGVLFLVFVICYLPFFLMYTIRGTCSACAPYISDSLLMWFEWLGYSGAAINPIMYHVFNKQFRNSFRRLIKCKHNRN